MKRITVAVLTGVVFGSFLGTMVLIQPPVQAQDNQQPATNQTQPQTKTNDTYEYVAQPGDSYSVLARKAVQTYGLENKVSLSEAQIIAAETWLTINADSPLLDEGQAVSIDKRTVKDQVERAQKLSKAKQALWQPYVAGVNFDTRNNGE